MSDEDLEQAIVDVKYDMPPGWRLIPGSETGGSADFYMVDRVCGFHCRIPICGAAPTRHEEGAAWFKWSQHSAISRDEHTAMRRALALVQDPATDDTESDLEQAMGEVKKAVEPPAATLSPEASAKTDQLIREMVAEAMEAERKTWAPRLEAAEAEAASSNEKLLGAISEFENYKKRVARETDERIQSTLGRLLADFLPLGDNLARAKDAAGNSPQILEGIEIVERSFHTALGKHEIVPVLSLGCSFDPGIHEALAERESESEPGIVVEEFEKGYTWKGRLLRPARVIVSSGKGK